MNNAGELAQENEALRERLSRLSQASLRINESLDLDTVLQEVVDSARALTGSRYGVITTLDDSGLPREFVTSGVTPEVHLAFDNNLPDGLLVYRYLSGLTEPLRIGNYRDYIGSLGLSDFLPFSVTSFLMAPIRHAGRAEGNIYLAKDDPDDEFTQEDEETLVMFASQAALVIANASQHRSEQQARANLETLIETSPVGVAVFDARMGALVSFNREAARIVGSLQTPGRPLEQLLEVLTIRRADGREISLEEFPMAQVLTGETVRAEEIVMQAPDGWSVTTLVNASPIYAEDGGALESMVVTLQDMTPLEEMERLRAELLGVVSHELRTPLAAIRGSATTMLDDGAALDPAEMRQCHRIIVEQADRMRALISDLLDVARIETGTLSVSPAAADVAVLVDEGMNTFLNAGGRNNVRIELLPDLPPVMADGRRIAQVLSNLLTNAAKHSPESSVIRVSAVRQGVHVAVSVADGAGALPPTGCRTCSGSSPGLTPRTRGGRHRVGLGGLQGDSGGSRRAHLG